MKKLFALLFSVVAVYASEGATDRPPKRRESTSDNGQNKRYKYGDQKKSAHRRVQGRDYIIGVLRQIQVNRDMGEVASPCCEPYL